MSVQKQRCVLPIKYREGNFTFPSSLKEGMEFQSVQQFQTYLEEEAKLVGDPLQKLFREKDFSPTVNSWTKVRYRCYICSNALRLVKKGDLLVVTTAKINHVHAGISVPIRNKHKRRIKIDEGWSYGNVPNEQHEKPTQPNFRLPPIEENMGQMNAPERLRKWFDSNKYRARVYINKVDSQPIDIALFASPSMMNSYSQYGDLLSFELFQEQRQTSEKSYKVGVFSVVDTNQRPLLAGLAIFREESPRIMCQILRAFTTIHQEKVASTIITGNQPFVIEAIGELTKQDSWKTVHQVRPEVILAELKKNLFGTVQHRAGVITNLVRAMVSRNRDEYQSILKLFEKDVPNKSAILATINKNSTLFYCQDKEATHFVGLGLVKTKVLIDALRRSFMKRVNLMDFLVEVDSIDAKFKHLSQSKFAAYEHDIEAIYSDPRLEKLRCNFEERVVQRFVENYTWGLRECLLIGRFATPLEELSIIRHSKDVETSYEVRNWRCQCKQFQRTGVACPHLILLATSSEGGPYLPLINSRWKKSQEPAASTSNPPTPSE